MIGLEFDGVLHTSVLKPNDDGIINPIKTIKNSPKKLTPNYKVIELLQDTDDEIYIITKRSDKKSKNTIQSFLKNNDIKINKKNIILAGKNKINKVEKLEIDTFYDCNENILEKLSELNIDLYQVDPYEMTIDHLSGKKERSKLSYDDYDDDDDDDEITYRTDTSYVAPINYIDPYINPYSDPYAPPVVQATPVATAYPIATATPVPSVIGYDFDGVLHKSVTVPDPSGQRHPISSIRHSPNSFVPNYNIINQVKNDYNSGKTYILLHIEDLLDQ